MFKGMVISVRRIVCFDYSFEYAVGGVTGNGVSQTQTGPFAVQVCLNGGLIRRRKLFPCRRTKDQSVLDSIPKDVRVLTASIIFAYSDRQSCHQRPVISALHPFLKTYLPAKRADIRNIAVHDRTKQIPGKLVHAGGNGGNPY